MTELEKYVPEVVDDSHAKMIVRLSKCKTCGHFMVAKPGRTHTFPQYHALQFEAQAKRAGFKIQSHVKVDDNYICFYCLVNDQAKFLCSLCRQRKASSKEQYHYGDPAEFLCTDCYDTVSAKVWEEAVKQIEHDHQYDFQ